MQQITVIESLEGKFGKQLKDKEGYLSFGKFYRGEQDFMPGTTLECDIFTTAKGNRYINSLKVLTTINAPAIVAPVFNNTPVAKAVPPAKKAFKKEKREDVDWDAISRGKVRSLFVEALLSNPNVVQSLGELDMEQVKGMLEPLVSYVFGD